MHKRERFSSRIGFILISAGCAIGLGNVWRFPYIAGMYGGALFVIIYLVFLALLGLPIMTMEFAVGRASRSSVACSFHRLEPTGTRWHLYSVPAMAGNYLLMMFYTTIGGWMTAYFFMMLRGEFTGRSPQEVSAVFDALVADPVRCVFWMVLICALGFGICALGLQKGVERITKVTMSSLFVVLLALVIRSVTLPGAGEGLAFYLRPNLDAFREHGLWTVIFAAMGQAFFTLSIGMGSMAIFGSYIGRDRRLFSESLSITGLDTLVAVMSGLVIFPACFAFGVNPGSGPGLVFVTLPNIFNQMPGGALWGVLFFLFMFFAALSTVIAVFENILSFAVDLTGCSRRKAAAWNFVALSLLSLPCALGGNLLSSFTLLGGMLDLEDFIVSNNILPLGSLVYLLFCVSRRGWGWERFLEEADAGSGLPFPRRLRPYLTYVLPVIVLIVFVFGYVDTFLLP